MIGPLWLTPGNRNWRGNGGAGSGGLGVRWEGGVGVSRSDSDSVSTESLWTVFVAEIGTVPHLPRTQPPTRRPMLEGLRGPGGAIELVLELSAETTDPVSDGTLLPAATEASRERDVFSELFARSIVMVGAETTGGVETSSTLGRTMRCGICIPGCQSPMREYRSVGVCISIPATDNRLSCDVDFRRGV